MRRRAFGRDRESGRAPTGEKRPSRSFSSPTELFLRRQEGLGSLEKLHVGKLGGQLHAFKAAFSSATALEGQQILVAEVHGQFVQVRFESRSEEHTSELQSHSDLVCRLLLEKKKKKKKNKTKT